MGIIAFGLVLLYSALTLPAPRLVRDPVGPMGLPIAIAAVFIIGGTLQAHRAFWVQRALGTTVSPDGPEDEPDHPVSNRRAVSFLAGSLAYVALIPALGYPIATPLMISLGLWALRYRSPWKVALISVVFTVTAFALFSLVLAIPVPAGLLTDLLVDLGVIRPVR
jgi:hypothetical protein